MVRANGSYPLCPGFKSLHRHHPLLKRFRKAVAATPLRDGDRLLLAVSGGKDSAGMLSLFLSALPRPRLVLGVAHIHHNLRGADADADAKAAGALARSLGLPFASARLRGRPPKGTSVEAWAREGRYAALERLRAEGGWDWIATAHTLDDQAETVLLRIARGAGLEGLAAVLPRAGRVLRPVLDFSGAELCGAARLCGMPVREDASNADRRFLRNRIRRDLLPFLDRSLPGFRRHLAALARHARLAAAAPGPADIAVREGETLYFPWGALRALGEGDARRQVRRGLKALRGDLGRITERHVDALVALRAARSGAVVALPGPWEGVRERGGLRLRPAPLRGGRT